MTSIKQRKADKRKRKWITVAKMFGVNKWYMVHNFPYPSIDTKEGWQRWSKKNKVGVRFRVSKSVKRWEEEEND